VIQCIAAENIYSKAGVKSAELLKINRDEINFYNGIECNLLMQAWFGDYSRVRHLPWSDKISPIFLGFHLSSINHTRERFVEEEIYLKMKPYMPIGCRDRGTMKFLRNLGVDAYFSGCLTLTFDKRENEPKNGKIFTVDVAPRVLKRLPKYITDSADDTISHFYYWSHYPVSDEGAKEFENAGRAILNRYRNEAKLVITSKIHAAMPCVAMGIPVVFITDTPKNERFDVLQGILPIYSHHDIKYVDFSPAPADIDVLKSAIISNAVDRVHGKKEFSSIKELERITSSMKPLTVRHIRYFPVIRNILKVLRKR
jgi:hypothetical protein